MSETSKAIGVLFLALSSVYSFQALSVGAERKANPAGGNAGTEVKLLDDAPGGGPTTKPSGGQSIGTQQVSVSDQGVEIHVNELDLVQTLRMLADQSKQNIIASKEVRGTVTANLYGVTLPEALEAILKGTGYVSRTKGKFIYVYSAKELADIDKAERQMATEVFHLYYTPASNAVNIIKPALSTEGQVSFTTASAVGIESSNKEAGGNSHATEDVIVVRDYPDNIERVKKIIKEVDKRPQQVLVEATIVAAELNEDNELGVDFNVVGGVDFTSFTHASGQIINANLPKLDDKASSAEDKVHSVGTGTNFTSPLKPGFKVGFVSSNVSVFLNALESTTDLAILANPKILTLNKQRGEVLVGAEDGYKTTAVTETTTVQTVEFLKTGTRLIFRPFIGDDGYIRMEIHPENSSGGLRNDLPFKSTTEVTTNIMVKDGHTIVIGGLFREKTQTDRSQVPGLGNLPVLGVLFRNQADTTKREEVIILLTPHIVKDERAYAKASEEELKDMEKLRAGVRRGLMPWGRERLAESAYKCAVDEMNKPNPDRKKALWHLDCATNLNPKFLEAIKMKESLTGRELTAVDNSAIHGFIKRVMLAERGETTSVPPTPTPTPSAEPAAVVPAAAIPADVVDQTCIESDAQAEAGEEPWDAAGDDEVVETPAPQPAPVVATTPTLAPTTPAETIKPPETATAVPTAPSTQPAQAEGKSEDMTVTELPTEPVTDQPSDDDDED